MNNLIGFIRESYNELRYKVSWPKYSELQSSSLLVLIASLIFALLIGVMDVTFDTIMGWFYESF